MADELNRIAERVGAGADDRGLKRTGLDKSAWGALRGDVPSLLLALSLVVLPLYRTRVLEDSFNTPKLAVAMVMGVLTAIGLLARAESWRMKLRWYPAPWLLVGLAVWQAVSVLWADSKPLGVDGTVYFATFAVLGWLFYRGPRSGAAVRGLFCAGAVGAVATAVWVLVDDFTGGAGALVARLPDWRGHLAAGLGNSGHIAGMVGMFLPWVLMCFLWRGVGRGVGVGKEEVVGRGQGQGQGRDDVSALGGLVHGQDARGTVEGTGEGSGGDDVSSLGGSVHGQDARATSHVTVEGDVSSLGGLVHGQDARGTSHFTGCGRWWLLVVIGLMFAALTVTWSVGSSGATIVSLVIWGFVAWRMERRAGGEKRVERGMTSETLTERGPDDGTLDSGYGGLFLWRRLGAVVGVGVLVLAFYFTPNGLNPHKPSLWSQAFGSARWEAGWPTRVVIWETTWQMIRQNPMVGIGTGNFTFGYTQQVVESVINDPALAPYSGAFTNDAHNDYLQLWAEGGVVGLALWVAVLSTFFVTVGRMVSQERDDERRLLLLGTGAGMTVFALDGLMSFPMRLPAHFAMAMFFLSVPGVLLRVGAAGGDGAAGLHPQRAMKHYGRRLRMGGIGILLTLAACVWHHGHRVVAEYYLKAGRTAADSAVAAIGGQLMPAWRACDLIYQQTLRSVAEGAPVETTQSGLKEMAALSACDGMDAAGDLFRKSLGADRWYSNASSRLGQLLLFQGDFAGSAKVSRRTLRTLQAYEIHERLGAAGYFMGDMRLAREHWSVCLTRRPEMAEFYSGLLSRLPSQ